MKIEATPAQIREIEKQLETVVDKLDAIISSLEDEREGDLWRMETHTPDREKIDKILREGMEVLKQGFITVKGTCYAE